MEQAKDPSHLTDGQSHRFTDQADYLDWAAEYSAMREWADQDTLDEDALWRAGGLHDLADARYSYHHCAVLAAFRPVSHVQPNCDGDRLRYAEELTRLRPSAPDWQARMLLRTDRQIEYSVYSLRGGF